ncbi:MAG: gliding motility protein GldN [Muribaculaceae bacterium]|nr:gliding motility protein GldN [Muribaculaceae bacterium]
MKLNRKIIPALLMAAIGAGAVAQVESGGVVRRRSENERNKKESAQPGVTDRMTGFYESKQAHEADLEYMRQIYRLIDLEKPENSPLYFPEDVVDGQENLFRLMFRLVTEGKLPGYEYLDGREVFTDKYKINVGEMLDRFDIYYTPGEGSTEKNPKYAIEESDVPSGQVNAYYIIEKWEYDRRTNRMRTRVEAICPVLTRMGDFGGEARYPMFWVKFDALRPYLAQQYIFLDNDNNLARYSLDDYFNLGMYDGDIYKTQNLKNLSMVQMFPDEDDLKRAQDSIDNRLNTYGKEVWVPTREEYLAQKAAEEERARLAAEGDTITDRTVLIADSGEKETKRATKKRASTKSKKQPKSVASSNSNSSAAKSVRRRKK